MSEPFTADALAIASVAEIRSGMKVGLGTGRTAQRGIRALADRVREEKLDITCVATSEVTEALARELGLKMIEFSVQERIDFLFDGADEVDREMRVLKGSGGAMTRERLVAWAADRVLYMVGENKVVSHLGTSNTLAIAVLPFGLGPVRAELRGMGLIGVCRRKINGEIFITDNGNFVVDVTIDAGEDLEHLAATLNDMPGIIDHGLFINEADEILIERAGGVIERMVRQGE